MTQQGSLPQLELVWPESLLDAAPAVWAPAGFSIRTHRPEDNPRFYELMGLVGWEGWDDACLQPWEARILPQGWFMVIHEGSQGIVASAMSLRSEVYPSGGELGWLVADPAYHGLGLGLGVSAAVTVRFIEEGCYPIHLFTDDFRLAALKTYLKLGYVPYLTSPGMAGRWEKVCSQLQWPAKIEDWQSASAAPNADG